MKPSSISLPQATLEAIESAFAIKNSHGVILACNQAFKDTNPDTASIEHVGLTAHDYLPRHEADVFAAADRELLSSPNGLIQHRFERQVDQKPALAWSISKSIAYCDDGSKEILVVVNKIDIPQLPVSHNLTTRELELLKLLISGKTQKGIAIAMGISHHTVGDYSKTIYRKMGVNTRTQAQLKGIALHGLG